MADLVFISTPEETFTPTRSGAIATHIHACCLCAMRAGLEPVVFGRPSAEADPYKDVESVLFAYPVQTTTRTGTMLRRAERRFRHWTHLGHGAYARQVGRLLIEHRLQDRPLIIHNDPDLCVSLRRQFPRATIIHWFHNQQTCKDRPRRQLKRAISAAIAVSDYTRNWACDWYGLDDDQVHRVYNGVDVEAFRPRTNGDVNSRRIVNFTGRTGIEKAPDLVLKAALSLARRSAVAPFSVQIIGANHWGARTMDAYQEELDGLAEQLRSADVEVVFAGHLDREETARRMQLAHVHVVPSRWDEPFGLTTVEGMACGLATVGSRTGGTPEIIGSDGLLFEREDVEQLADHLEHLLGDDVSRRDFAVRARRRAEQFTWQHTWEGLEAVLRAA